MVKGNILTAFESLALLKQDVHEWYIKYATTSHYPEMLDSFLFQRKLLDMEYDHYHKMYQFIENRSYGDYYKLYTAMCTYCKKENPYTVYKDLEPYKVYGSIVDALYEDVRACLAEMEVSISEKRTELEDHRQKIAKGLNIGNYFNIMEHKTSLMEDQLKLFKNHFQTYNQYHKVRYTNLLVQLKLTISKSNHTVANACIVCCENTAEYCAVCSRNDFRATMFCKTMTNEFVNEPVAGDHVSVEEPVEPVAGDQVSVEEPLEEPVEEPVVEPSEEPVVEPVVEPVEEPVDPVEEHAGEPVEPVEEPVEPVAEPAEEPVVEPVVEEPVVEPVAEEPVVEPVVEPAEEPVAEDPVSVENVDLDESIDSLIELTPVLDSPPIASIQELLSIKMTPSLKNMVRQIIRDHKASL